MIRYKLEMNLLGQITEEMHPKALAICRRGANRIRTLARRGMRRSTRSTRTGQEGRKYIASAPGGPPGVITHELERAMRVRKTGRLTMQVDFGTDKSGMDHVARFLEVGTARIAARPFFYQAVQDAAPKFEQEMQMVFDPALSVPTETGDDD